MGQEHDEGAPPADFGASASSSSASVEVEAVDAGGGEAPPQAARKIAVDAMAVQCPTTFLWLSMTMALSYTSPTSSTALADESTFRVHELGAMESSDRA